MLHFFSSKKFSSFFPSLTALLLLTLFSRFSYFVIKLSSLSFESSSLSLAFFALSALISFAPGLFLWSCLSPKTSNPFLPPVFILSTSLGTTMSVTWLLYALGLYSRFSAFFLFSLFAFLALFALFRLSKNRLSFSAFSISLPELLVLASSLLFCEALFESVTGFPSMQMDAAISWDKWASDISHRSFLGGYVSGAYPQGMPLIISLFYKTLLSPSSSSFLSLPHLLSAGFFSLFPLLLFLSLLAFSRQMKMNPLWPFLLLIGNSFFVLFMIKNPAYMDIPLAAVVTASFALLSARNVFPVSKDSRLPLFLSFFFSFFAIAFTKGNGFAFLFLGFLLALFFSPRNNKLLLASALSAITLAALFYLHQWLVGVWFPSLSETSPFHHALSVRSSHFYLIQHGFAHTFKQIRIWCNAYGFHSSFSVLLSFLLTLSLTILSCVQRKTRLPAFLSLICFSIWFVTSSYDARNALFLIPLFSLLLPLAFHLSLSHFPLLRSILFSILTLLTAFSASQTRFFQLSSALFSRPSFSPFISQSPVERSFRSAKITPENYRFLSSSPFASRSPFISFDTAFSRFFTNGVYSYQQNGKFAHVPHSLLFSHPPSSTFVPDSYSPIALFKQGHFINNYTLFFNASSNSFSSVPFSFNPPFLSLSIPPSLQGCGAISLFTDIPIASHVSYSVLSPVSIDLVSPSSFTTNFFSPIVVPFFPSVSSNTALSRINSLFYTSPSATNLTFNLSSSSPFSIHRVEIAF